MSFGDFSDQLDSAYDWEMPEEEIYNWQQQKKHVDIFATLFFKWQNLSVELQKNTYELIQLINTSDDQDEIDMALNTITEILYPEE